MNAIRPLVGILVFAMAALVWTPLSSAQKPAGPSGERPPMPVEAAPVRQGVLAEEISAVGTLQANESVVIRAELAGRILAIEFEEGRSVKAGQVLVRLDSAEWEAQTAQAEATLALATANLERAEPLRSERLISPQGYDELVTTRKQAEADLAVAKDRLEKSTIRAPFGGRLGLRQVSVGDYVQPGQAIVTLDDLSAIKADFRVSESDVGRIKRRQAITVRVDAFPHREFSGSIIAIDSRLDPATRTVHVRARVPNNRGELFPGMFARVNVAVGRQRDTLLVPEHALVPTGDATYVFRIVDGRASMVAVKVGRRARGEVEITTGLAAGDVVVTGGQMKIRDGAPVTVIDSGGPPGSQSAP